MILVSCYCVFAWSKNQSTAINSKSAAGDCSNCDTHHGDQLNIYCNNHDSDDCSDNDDDDDDRELAL